MNKKYGFPMGRVVMTRGIADAMADEIEFARHVTTSLARYRAEDWGEMNAEDKKENDAAVAGDFNRIFAAYTNEARPEWKIWIITEADRSYTTILFPSEY